MARNEKCDVLIVGGGTSAGILAKQLAEDGFSVVCLEQGDWVQQSQLPGDKPEYELLADGPWNGSPNVRRLAVDYPCDVAASDIEPWMFNAVGGTSIIYGACWSRMLPSDFRVKTLDGVADDWPLTYQELLPYYEETDREMAVSGLGGDPSYPASAPPPLPAHPINKTGRKAAEGMNKLGWHWWPGPVAIPSQPYGLLAQCARLGICRMGCPQGAKASTDLTHWPIAIRHGARIVTGARVREIQVDNRGLASGAVYLDTAGNEHFQAGDVVILAANAIGTARLLLLSASARFPNGLANTSGLVGKRLMMHPYTTVAGIFEDYLDDWLGTAGQQIQSMQFYESDPSRGFIRGCKWSLQPSGGLLSFLKRHRTSALHRWGDTFHADLLESVGHLVEWAIIPEDLPEEKNSISLSDALRDSSGIPAPSVAYRVSENTQHMLAFNVTRAIESLEAAGATRTWVSGTNLSSGHLLGTARMGVRPETSVTNPFGRTHDVPNLYIADGSVFVTSSGVNPASTICSLARRMGRHLVANARNQKTPL